MIRFSCPHCGREYVLANALAHLPLLCKGCGQRLAVPDSQPDLPLAQQTSGVLAPGSPKAEAPLAHAPVSPDQATPVAHAPGSPQPVDDFLSQETIEKLDVPAEPTGPPPGQAWGAPVVVKTPAAHAPGSPTPSVTPQSGKVLAVAADVVVALVLLGLGVLLGEFATRKPTHEILEGISGPKFPSTDLLIWLGCPVMLELIYLWLGTRGRTLGAWLRRRSAK